MRFKHSLSLLIALLGTGLWAPPVRAESPTQLRLHFQQAPQSIPAHYLEQRIREWLLTHQGASVEAFRLWLHDLYLQRGNPNLEVQIDALFSASPEIIIHEHPEQVVILARLQVTGGTPLQRWMVRQHLPSAREQKVFDPEGLAADLHGLEHSQFLPLALHYHSERTGHITAEVAILDEPALIPTGNIALNASVGLALTAGVIADNLWEGTIFRAAVKRNNIPLFSQTPGLVQDWEYLGGASTTSLPWPGTSLGFNHYNKVDYIYRGLGNDPQQLKWIQSFGGDIYGGFPVWSDPENHRYLRGVANLSLIQDSFFSGPDKQPPQPPLSRTGKASELLILPSLNLLYSDLDNAILPRNGHFLRSQLSGSPGETGYLQGTLTGLSFWTPTAEQNWQATFLFRHALGTTLGHNAPFYRGFLNTGLWLVRGAREFSATEKHSVRLAQEFHLIHKPSGLQLDDFFRQLTGQSGLGQVLEGWSFDLNAFLDEGAYWNDSPVPRLTQASLGGGVAAILPFGTVVGFDLAVPIWPQLSGPAVLLRLSAPLTFTFYADWLSSNGFFLR